MMATDHFDVVTIETNRPGVHLNVTNTLQVAELLVDDWPAERGPSYKKAVKASMDHMSGKASADAVRKAFIAAAKEANIFVREGPLFQ